MKFDIKDYDENTVMHCTSLDEAEYFTNYLSSIGLTWRSGRSYKILHRFEEFNSNTGYRFNIGEYGNITFYAENNYTILEFDDFEWDGRECVSESTEKEVNDFVESLGFVLSN